MCRYFQAIKADVRRQMSPPHRQSLPEIAQERPWHHSATRHKYCGKSQAAIQEYNRILMDGWLKAPKGRNVLRFHREPSARYEALIFVDLGEPIPGQPALLKRRERIPRKQAVEQWKKLQKEGWRRVEAQW